MDISKINESLIKIEVGLNKYINIMKLINYVDVSADKNFQRLYNGFYRVRQRDESFYKTYYSFMQDNKYKKPTFEETLVYLSEKLNRIEASFTSKLVATLNPDMPIWDSFVLDNLGLKRPYQYSINRLEKTVELYKEIEKWYESFLQTKESKEIIDLFNKKYPKAKITDVKKIDFVLWQIR